MSLTQSRHISVLFDLTGQVALVTGGAGRYGRHICTALAEAGAHVVVASRNQQACAAFADELTGRGLSASAVAVDLASEDSIRDCRDAVIETHDRLDVLVNNAVHYQGGSPEATSAADWEATSRINSTGLFLMTKYAIEGMLTRRSGSVINISSIYSVVGPDFGVYDSKESVVAPFYGYDKAGMVGLTRYLATYHAGDGVRVNCISPSGLRSADHSDDFVARYSASTPLGRMAGPDDIKGAVVFLASDAGAYVTGINLLVDGGWTAK